MMHVQENIKLSGIHLLEWMKYASLYPSIIKKMLLLYNLNPLIVSSNEVYCLSFLNKAANKQRSLIWGKFPVNFYTKT